MKSVKKYSLLLMLFGPVVRAEMLNTSAALDIVNPLYTSQSGEGYKVDVRSAELMFYSPVDHLFDGVINFAGHNEGGEFFWEVHEAHLSSSKLIPRSRFRVGKFFLGVGRLNQFHQHDWPFSNAPKSHRTFFASEGASDTGIEYTFLVPMDSFLELNVGVTSGYYYGHAHGEDGRPPRPLFYAHPTFFVEDAHGGTLYGFSYLNRVDINQTQFHLMGFDITRKVRQSKLLKWMIQSEVFLQTQTPKNQSRELSLGGYVFVHHGLSSEWSAGLRLDGFSDLSKTFESTGDPRSDFDIGVVPQLTYKASEFSTLRLSYEYSLDTTGGLRSIQEHLVNLQIGFILGAHPAHDF